MISAFIFILNLYFTLILLTSGLAKLASPDYAVLNTIKLPNKLIPFGQALYQTLAWVEIALSVLLATNTIIHLAITANIVLFAMLLVFQIMTFAIRKDANCGCFGNIYKLRIDKIHMVATAGQVLLSLVYYWLVIVYREVSYFQTIASLFVFSGLGVWILIRRFSLATRILKYM